MLSDLTPCRNCQNYEYLNRLKDFVVERRDDSSADRMFLVQCSRCNQCWLEKYESWSI